MSGQGELLEVVDALGTAGRLAGSLHGGQQECDQDRDDRDHDQKLDQGEAGLLPAADDGFHHVESLISENHFETGYREPDNSTLVRRFSVDPSRPWSSSVPIPSRIDRDVHARLGRTAVRLEDLKVKDADLARPSPRLAAPRRRV